MSAVYKIKIPKWHPYYDLNGKRVDMFLQYYTLKVKACISTSDQYSSVSVTATVLHYSTLATTKTPSKDCKKDQDDWKYLGSLVPR
jgi:hypothetical protein